MEPKADDQVSLVASLIEGYLRNDGQESPSGRGALLVRDAGRAIPDEVADELEVGVKDVLATENQRRLRNYLTGHSPPMPALFSVNNGVIALATKRQGKEMVMAAAGVETPEALADVLKARDVRALSARPRPTTTVASDGPALKAAPVLAVPKPTAADSPNDALLAAFPAALVPLAQAAHNWWQAGMPESERLLEEQRDVLNAAGEAVELAAAPAADQASTDEQAATGSPTGDVAALWPEAAVDVFRSAVILPNLDRLDLFGPWREPPAHFDAGLPEYVSVLMPYHDRADPDAAVTMRDAIVGDHDVWRLARYTNTTHFVTVASLGKGPVGALLGHDVLHVIGSRPQLFEYMPPPASSTAVTKVGEYSAEVDGQTVMNVAALFYQDPAVTGLPDLARSTPTLDDAVEWQKEEVDLSLGAVRFVLADQELRATLHGPTADMLALTIDDLRSMLQMLTKLKKASREDSDVLRREMQQAYKLKKLPPRGAGAARFKHNIIRSMLSKRFPRGTVFMDRHVLAYFIFDSLPLEGPVDVLRFRNLYLPEDGRTVFPISSDFICGFPHLWQPKQQGNSESWTWQRRDSPNLPPDDDPDALTDDDIVQQVLVSAPGGQHFDPERKTSYSSVQQRLPEVMRKAVRRKGGMATVMRRHPQHFEVLDDEYFKWLTLKKVDV